jgi:flagellar basal-body rod protein FlgB
MIDFDDGPLALATRQLAALDLRAKVVLHNIANQNTPGYKRYYVSFEERLREAHRTADAKHEIEPQVLRDESGPPGINNVSVIDEQGTLEKVRLLSDIVSRQIGGQFNKLNRAIAGR